MPEVRVSPDGQQVAIRWSSGDFWRAGSAFAPWDGAKRDHEVADWVELGPVAGPVMDPVRAGLAEDVNGVRTCTSCGEPLDGDAPQDAVAHWKDAHGLVRLTVTPATTE